jgi:multidrug resistance efflux pump
VPALYRLAFFLVLGMLACREQSGGDESLALRSAALLLESGGDAAEAAAAPGLTLPTEAVIVQGLVEPLRFAEIGFEVPGTVAEVLVSVGDSVKEGEIVAVLETADREAQLAETRTRWQAARRAAPGGGETREGNRPPAYVEEEMQERLGRAQEEAAHRAEDLAAVRAAVRGAGEESAGELATDIARRRSRVPDYSVIRRASNDRLARALEEDLGQRVRQLEFALQASRLRSPVDGVVVGIHVRPGHPWQTRSVEPAFEIVDRGSLVVQATVPAARAGRLELGERAWIEVPPAAGRAGGVLPGKVVAVAGEAEGVAERLVSVLPENPDAARLDVAEELRVGLSP